MKYIILVTLLILAGCGGKHISIADKNAVNPDFEMIRYEDNLGNYEIWVHKPTGCHFLATGSSYGGFTQIIQPNGKPYCPGE